MLRSGGVIAIVISSLVCTQGCSLLLMKRVPPHTAEDCTSESTLPAMDTIATIVATALLLASTHDNEIAGVQVRPGLGSLYLLLTLLAVPPSVFAGSALAGYVSAARCSRAKAHAAASSPGNAAAP
jgi:hypothetical protein